MIIKPYLRVLFSLLLTLPWLPLAVAQTDSTAAEPNAALAQQDQIRYSVRQLLTIRQVLEERRERVRNLLQDLKTADEVESEKIRKQIEDHRQIIEQLSASFENIAVEGASLRSQSGDEEQQLAWHQELLQIARPLLDSLKEATEKPRRIAELRAAIEQYQQQLEVARKAVGSLERFDQQELPAEVAEGLRAVEDAWRQRNLDIQNSLRISREELRSIEVSETEVLETLGRFLREFLLGSGLTLLLALSAGLAVWMIMRGLRRLTRMWRRRAEKTQYAAKVRLLFYAYHLLSMALAVLAVLAVFYVRGDLLLLSLGIITLAVLALGIWRFLPGYITEARLLLNVGAAREGERVIYQGLPMLISTLNLYSELRNPELEGTIRLPLSELTGLVSRPETGESWFSSRVGDYVLLPDGGFGQVLRQTVELVQLKIIGSIVQYPSAEYLNLNLRNLSREGFGVIVAFGIDYQHQDIALDRVPRDFESAIRQTLEQAGFGDDLKNLLVEFKSAGASSLDYLVYATMDGRSAASYFRLERLIQQTCVDVCNREGWVIPFTQVTIHSADAAATQKLQTGTPRTAST